MGASRFFAKALRRLPEPTAGRRSVCVGLSGGVDSAVTAALLQARGFAVSGAYLRSWSPLEEDNGTAGQCSDAEEASAEKVASRLKLDKFFVCDGVSTYWTTVFAPFLTEYSIGRIPNPDLACNKFLKFGVLASDVKQRGFDFFATGHYARLRRACRDGLYSEEMSLLRGIDESKDQTYFLASLNSANLRNVMFPLGWLRKTEVRDIASWLGLPNAAKKSSKGICFIGERRMSRFLQQFIEGYGGTVYDLDSNVVSEHAGDLHFHSINQRLKLGGLPGRTFVVAKEIKAEPGVRPECNLIVTSDSNHPLLFTESMTCDIQELRQSYRSRLKSSELNLSVKTCYRQKPISCRAKIVSGLGQDKLLIKFDKGTRRTSRGQCIVLYDEEECLGGGQLLFDGVSERRLFKNVDFGSELSDVRKHMLTAQQQIL